METKSYGEIVETMRNYVIAHQDRLTDFNDGSVIESQIEAIARELAMLYVRCRVGFSSYLRALPYSVFGFRKKEGTKASVNLVFSRAKPWSGATLIPSGTVVAAGGLKFMTTEPGSVPSGAKNSGTVTAVAEAAGEKYNAGAGSITAIMTSLPSDIVSVNNADAATGGLDGEDWGAYAARFSDYIIGLSRTNYSGFLSAITGTSLARSVAIDEHFPPADNIWNATVYFEDGSGGMTDEAIALVKAKIDGDRTAGNRGCRPPGINIRYRTPQKVQTDLDIAVVCTHEALIDMGESVIMHEVTEAARKFVNSLHIGASVIMSDLTVVVKRLSYVVDVKFPGEDNINIGQFEIARFRGCNVTVATQ